MLTIYRLGKSCLNDRLKPVKYSINIDPGLNTGGITVINHVTKKIDISSYQGEYDAMESQYPKLFKSIFSSTDTYLQIISDAMDRLEIPEDGFPDLEITMEYTGTWGQFSIGLFTFLSSLNTKMLSKPIRGLTLIPPQVGKYFLFEKYKENLKGERTKDGFDVKNLINMNTINVSKTELKRLVELEFPNIIPKKTLKKKDKATGEFAWKFDHTNHMADSLLMGVYRHFNFFKELYPKMTLKEPNYDLIELIEN